MARKRMVTRTITTTTAHCKLYTKSTCEMSEALVVYGGSLSYHELFKKASAELNDDDTVVVDVFDWKTVEIRYGMPEEDFISHSEKLEIEGKEEN